MSENLQENPPLTAREDERGSEAHTQDNSIARAEMDDASLLEQAFMTSPAKQRFLIEHAQAVETRAILKVSDEALPNHLTAHTLAGPGRISVAPYVLIDNELGSLMAYYHLGNQLSGHRGLVHEGFLAVLLDECMGRACISLLPAKNAVTARIELDYRSPVESGSIIVIRAETERVEGRKAWVKGFVEAVGEDDGQVLVECHALFVQPKWVAGMGQLM